MTGRHNHTRWLGKARRALPLALAVALLIALFGCDGEAALDTAVPTRTRTPTWPAPTSTPPPATSTPIPTPTSSPLPTAPAPTSAPDELRSDLARVTTPAATDSDLAALVEGNSAFAFDLYHALGEKEKNLFYSPYSISVALAMTYAGARGETESQMADALRFRLSQDRLHSSLNSLDLKLASRGRGGDGFRLSIANAIWGQQGYRFLPGFLDVLALSYGAGLRPVNFVEAPERSRVTINDWVADRTEDRVKDLIPAGAIDVDTRLVLTNAIYFKAAWLSQFEESSTVDRAFNLLDGGVVQTPMMTQTAWFGYTDGDGYLAIDLPYKGNEMSMAILVPDAGEFSDFAASLDADLVSQALAGMGAERVRLTMPLFKFESQLSLNETLKAMGMPNAFDGGSADFSGMNGVSCTDNPMCLRITDVVHKAFVAVDEEGTEAAAATGVVVGITSMPPEPVQVVIDRPFLFLIRNVETGAILFVGRVMNPSA